MTGLVSLVFEGLEFLDGNLLSNASSIINTSHKGYGSRSLQLFFFSI